MKFQNITFYISNEVENFLSTSFSDIDKRDFIITSFLIYHLRTNRDWSIGITTSHEDGYLTTETHTLKVDLNPDLPFKSAFEDYRLQLQHFFTQQYFTEDSGISTAVESFKKSDFNIIIKKVKKLSEPVIDYTEALTLVISEGQECKFIYNQDIWRQKDVEAIAHHLEVLQNSIIKNPDQPIKLLRLLSDEEWKKVVYDWNDYIFPYPKDKTIHQLFEEHVAKSPDAIAVRINDKTLTYRELNDKSNQLARYLQKNGVGSEAIIGICIERSLEMIIGLMGILKAGACYTPLDLNYPLERLEYMLDMTESPYVITVEKWRKSLPANTKASIFLDTDKAEIEKESTENIEFNCDSMNLSCVLFTSGSTGKPKGVCLPHKGVVRLVKGTNYVTLNEDTIMMQVTTLAFDPSLLEVWGALTNGGQLVLVPSMQPSMAELKEIVKKNQINTIFLSTALMHLFIEQDLSDLTCIKHLMTGGDVYSLAHGKMVVEQLPNAMIMNGYGPTENTTYSSFFEIKKDNLIYPTVPIGIPISNSQMYVLDKWHQPLPIGVPGELYTAGDGLARGYLKRPDLTAERFVHNPFHTELSPTMYKTGDQSRYLPDGNVEFMGRFDNQVKVRGIRIELGEIEATINLYPGVSESVVIANGTNANDKQLFGYVVAIPGSNFTMEGLKEYLENKLPKYMIPPFMKQLESFPLTPNGKIDKKNLPLPSSDQSDINNVESAEAFNCPLTEKMVGIWKQVLQLNRIGIRENFFLLGGNSLMAVKLISEINLKTGINLPVITVFSNPTIAELIKYIKEDLNDDSWSSLVPIQPNGKKKPLYCVHPVSGEVDYVYRMAPFFSIDQPLYGLQATGLNGKEAPLTSIEEMAQHYLKLILQNDPEGPYHIAGYSLGGIIAYEMAVQLTNMGKKVETLALFDTYPHKRGKFTYLHMPIPTVIKSFKNYILDPSIDLTEKLKFISKKTPELVSHATNKFKKPQKEAVHEEVKTERDLISDKLKAYGTRASLAYNLKPYDGRVIFFRAVDGPARYVKNFDFGWKRHVKNNIEIFDLPGGHLDFFLVPSNPETIAKTLESYLR